LSRTGMVIIKLMGLVRRKDSMSGWLPRREITIENKSL